MPLDKYWFVVQSKIDSRKLGLWFYVYALDSESLLLVGFSVTSHISLKAICHCWDIIASLIVLYAYPAPLMFGLHNIFDKYPGTSPKHLGQGRAALDIEGAL